MASTSSSSVVKYPFPSEVNVANFVPIKLGGSSNYSLWKKLMLNLIESNELEGFVDGTIKPPPFSLEERMQEECRSWKRSDGLVRGWIFVTVTEKILRQLVLLATARDAWIALEDYSDPSVKKCEDERATMIASQYLPLYKAIRNGDWDRATNFFDRVPNAVRAGITANSETALMLAVRLSNRKIRKDFVEKLMMTLSGMSEEDVARDVARTDKFGQTALHKASESGDIHLANFLVQRNRALPNILDNDGYNPRQLAVHCAARRGNRRMVVYLLEVTNLDGDPNPFEGELGVRLLNNLVNGELYDIASTFLQRYPKLASMEPHSLERVSYQLTSFRSGTRLNFFQRLIYSGIPLKLEGTANRHDVGDVDMHVLLQVEVPAAGVVSPSSYSSQKLPARFLDVVEKLVPTIKSVRKTKLIHHQALNFVKHLCKEVVKLELSQAGVIFRNSLLTAATMGTSEIIEEILELFPSGIHLANHTRQTLFHVAIEYRQVNVFNLIYQLEESQNLFLSICDDSGNNSLHTAGKFSSQQQLSLQANMAGAALQLQRELQWFKAVEKLMHPQYIYSRNNENKTPQDVFTETHKDLVDRAEKWMKDTASSCTIVAALVVTVVFAAAITVPGGIDNNNGLPIFLEDKVFLLFGSFDALALFSSTTSLLMFLSIFTSRYGEHDFLYSLPRRLIIGLVTLFLSIISMMIAFVATLNIVFGHKRAWVVLPVAILSSVPITFFALLQFPLLLDMIRSTYYPGLFKKRSNRIMF